MASSPGEAPKRRASRASRDALAAIHPLVCVSWVATMILWRAGACCSTSPPLPSTLTPRCSPRLARWSMRARSRTTSASASSAPRRRARGDVRLRGVRRDRARSFDANDLRVDLSVHRPTGSFRLNFLNNDIANAYTSLTNVVVGVAAAVPSSPSPRRAPQRALRHHLGSPGAADCAACVGILLEILRLHVAALPPPGAPLVFLFNGGEETFMQAAHGSSRTTRGRATRAR